jgi:hypothetical protein
MDTMVTGASRHTASGPSQVFATMRRIVMKAYSLETKASAEETLFRSMLSTTVASLQPIMHTYPQRLSYDGQISDGPDTAKPLYNSHIET